MKRKPRPTLDEALAIARKRVLPVLERELEGERGPIGIPPEERMEWLRKRAENAQNSADRADRASSEKHRENERLKDDLRAALGVLASCCYYDHNLLDRRRAMVNVGGPFWKDLDRVEELLWTWEAERMRATKK